MTFKLGKKSLENLHLGVHPDLVKLVNKVIEITPVDFAVVEGVRSKARAEELFNSGKSKTKNSKHCLQKDGYGHAIDIVGCYEKYEKARDIFFLVGLFYGVASMMGIKIRVGALWEKDSINKNSWVDAYHIEIKD